MILGIDGGGTRCRARLVDHQGKTLGEGAAGPANLGLGVEIAAAAVRTAANAAFAKAELPFEAQACTLAGLGLAGANVPSLAERFRALPMPFASVRLASDAVAACIGAHAGRDGAILILGTGSAGLVLKDGAATSIGGWGFLLGDEASGAAIGHAAMRAAVAAADGLGPKSELTEALLSRFDSDPAEAVLWAMDAIPRDYATLAPQVFATANRGDIVARAVLQQAAAQVDRMVARLVLLGATRVALMGGLATPYMTWVNAATRSVVTEPLGDAIEGSLRLAVGQGSEYLHL